jgi:hypothetical protein
MAERPITIRGVCDTAPDQHVHVNPGDKVRWRANHAEIFVLHIKGGFFQDHPTDFLVWVLAEIWTSEYVVAGPVGSQLSNYIYNLQGKNCEGPLAAPPDIIIDSGIIKHPKKAASKKKTATKKKR